MRNTIIRWTVYLSALLVFGPIAGRLMASVPGVDGGPEATALVSASPAAGLGAGLGAVGIALVVGMVAARLLGAGPGMSAAGLVMAWAAWRSGSVDGLVRAAGSGGPLVSLAVEGVIFGALGILMVLVLHLVGRGAGRGAGGGAEGLGAVKRVFGGRGVAVAVPVGILAAAVVAWLLAATPLKGQAVMAAVLAAVAAAAAARLVDFQVPMASLILPVAALAVVGPLLGLALAGGSVGGANPVVAAVYRGSLFPVANITPLDWVAGGLLGIPLGVAWAGSMIEKGAAKA